jgi:RHS repeat-associated protein
MVNQAGNAAYATFAYDLAGNVVKRTTPEGDWSLEWDGLGQIRRVQSPEGVEVYYYDHTGARMVAVSEQDGVRFWFAERETHYGLDGTRTRRYLHLSGGGPTLARVKDGSEIELQYSDALQNLLVSLDSKGQVVASFLYGPFGEVVQSVGAEDHRRQFNGEENDAITGLRYYGFRYYDPLSLRWNSSDPMYRFAPEFGQSEPQRMNLYSFSLNNPVRYYDPDGRDADNAEDDRTDAGDLTCELPEPGTCEADEKDSSTSDAESQISVPLGEVDGSDKESGSSPAALIKAAFKVALSTKKGEEAFGHYLAMYTAAVGRTVGHPADEIAKAVSTAKSSGKVVHKGLAVLGVVTGGQRALQGEDGGEQILGALEAGSSALSLKAGPVGLGAAVFNAGLTIGSVIDSGGHVSDWLSDRAMQVHDATRLTVQQLKLIVDTVERTKER